MNVTSHQSRWTLDPSRIRSRSPAEPCCVVFRLRTLLFSARSPAVTSSSTDAAASETRSLVIKLQLCLFQDAEQQTVLLDRSD